MWGPTFQRRGQAVRDLDAANGRQASLVEPTEELIERLTTKERIAGEIVALPAGTERVLRGLLTQKSIGCDGVPQRLSIEIETLSKEQMASQLQEMQTVTETAVRDLDMAHGQLATLVTRAPSVESVEKLTKEEIADELLVLQTYTIKAASDLAKSNAQAASFLNRCDSIGKLTKEEIVCELQALQSATAKAARDLASAFTMSPRDSKRHGESG